MREFRSLLILALLASGVAFAAGKKPGEFNAPAQMTEEELAEAKARSKSHLNGFDEKGSEKPKDPPWMLIGMVAISFIVATPFALRAFRGTSKEISESTAALKPTRRREE
jgi:hypothetical protein